MGERRVYSRPPIVEAVCEFRFTGGPGWDWTIPGLFFERVKADFPQKRQQNIVELSMSATEQKVTPKVKGGVAKMQFLSAKGDQLITVGPDMLSAHWAKTATGEQYYPGWDVFRPHIESAYKNYLSIAEPEGVVRIGLRYINRINVDIESINLDQYLRTPPQLPDELPQDIGTFVSRTAVSYDEETTLALIMASPQDAEPGTASVVLDLDFVYAKPDDTLEPSQAMAKVDDLRVLERDAFEALITDDSRRLFDA